MLFSSDAYIGIDLTPGKKAIALAALDSSLVPITLRQGDLQEALAFLGGQQSARVAVCGPARPSQNILIDVEKRANLLIPLTPGRPGNMRVAEYQLGQAGLPIYRTPAALEDAPSWMQTSFSLYRQLEKMGFEPYQPGKEVARQMLETPAELCLRAWLPGSPMPPNTLLGRIQRQLALYDLGLELPDPMEFFEEITRFRILQGALPESSIYPLGQLNALAAAYLAYLSHVHPEQITLVGVPAEGQIAIPAVLLAA